MSVRWNDTLVHFRRCRSTINCSPDEVRNEQQMAQLQETTIKAHCKSLRMPTVATQFGSMAEQAIREKQSHIGYLEALPLAEIEEREPKTIERRIKEAHLRRVKTLEEARLRAIAERYGGEDARLGRGWLH
jgi:DNA replication protein DnaC